jgi:TetR/AcrR family transcriptional repressor of mexJK operon
MATSPKHDSPDPETCIVCKPAGRPRADELEARNHNLIMMAGRLFLEKGYSKVSLELIAREARVAVRTIYVKFGGKPGLFSAVLLANRNRFFTDVSQLETDQRPVREVLDEFGASFLDMITSPDALKMQRMVIAESTSNPELVKTFFETGPRETRAILDRYFARPEIAAQLRDDVAPALIAVHLLNCVMGDQFSRFLFDPDGTVRNDGRAALHQRLELFYRAVLR